MIHPATELRFISPEMGFGVVATEFIPKGTMTWVLDDLDRQFSPEDFNALKAIYKEILDKYSFRDNKGNYVLCWDIGRYINHSFHSNCMTTAYNFEIAIRDIQPGEELTDDYGYLNISQPFRGIDEGTRRKTVYPDDLLKYFKIWDKKILKAFKHLQRVDQPLRPLISEEVWDTLHLIESGQKDIDSILTCYYSDSAPIH